MHTMKPLWFSVTSVVKSHFSFQIGNEEFTTGDTGLHGETSLELQLPGFGDQVFAAPAVVFFFGHQFETGMTVDFAGGG